jgi:O-antigen/teichoic acid export membrane protein
LISQGVTFLGTILLARILGTSEFGLVALSLVYIGFVQIFIDAGFLQALIQRPYLSQRELAGCFWFLLLAGVAAFGISWLSSDFMDRLFAAPGIGLIIVAQSSIFLFLPFRIISQSLLSREVLVYELSKREAVLGLFRFAASLWMAWQGFGVWSLVLPQVAGEIAFSLSCYRRAEWRLTVEFDWSALKPLLRFGIDVSLSRIVWFAASRADQFIIGRMLGIESLGLYSLALQFAGALPQFAAGTLSRVAFPVFSMLQAEPERMKKAFLGMMKYTVLVCVPAFAGIGLVAADFFLLAFAPPWQEAVIPLQVLCLLAFMKLMEAMAGFVINAKGCTRMNLHFNVLAFVATSLGVFAGTRIGSVIGVAVMATIAFVPVVLLVMKAAMGVCGGRLGDLLDILRRPLLATLTMVIAVVALGALLPDAGHLMRLLAASVVGAAVYVLATIWLSPGIVGEIRNELLRYQTV